MSLREDLNAIACLEGFEDAARFFKHYIIDEGWSFTRLKKYIEKRYRRYYCRTYIYILGCQLLEDACLLPAQEEGKDFKYAICGLQWQKRAEKMNYKTIKEMFEAHKGQEEALAEKLGLGLSTIWLYRKRFMGGKDET